jgi:protein SCO1
VRPHALAVAVVAAAAFASRPAGAVTVPVAGVPDAVLRTTQFYDQSRRRISLEAFRGKTVLLSFFVTSGPTRRVCDALSGKFAYLQAHLDPKRYHLMLVSLEPQNDSPDAIRRYAQLFGADPRRWTLANGRFSDVVMFDWYFELATPLHSGPAGHAQLIEVFDPAGRFTGYIDADNLAPDDIIARM